MNLIYIDDYKADEETILRELGILCYRFKKEEILANDFHTNIETTASYQVRSQRLTFDEYRNIYHNFETSGVNLVTTPISYEIGATFSSQYELLAEMSPGALVIKNNSSNSDILKELINSGLQFPLFLRSEVESAAKYVGVDGCIIITSDENAISLAVKNLRDNVSGFNSLIFKEVAEIEEDTASGKHLEYRAIGVSGKVVCFDFDELKCDLPSPEKMGLLYFANDALSALSQGGANGGLFIDVALTKSKKPIVVECKNLLNGTISNIYKFGKALTIPPNRM